MTLVKELSKAPSAESVRPRRWSFAQYAWALLAIAVLAWMSRYVVPLFATLDPARTGFRFREDFPLHYPILVMHAMCGSVVLLTACLQLWPWLRRAHPVVHRVSGRLYVFAGAIPAAVALVVLLPLRATVDGPQAVNTIMFATITVWLSTTIAGYRMARQGRYSEHRRWMTYSIATAMAVVLPGPVIELIFANVDFTVIKDLGWLRDVLAWLPWAVTLTIAHLWLKRTSGLPATGADNVAGNLEEAAGKGKS